MFLMPPENLDPHPQWELIKLDNGTYNIKSFTNKMYLDGTLLFAHLTSAAAHTNRNFMWRIKEYTYNGKTKYAIQSVANNRYLDGRNPEDVGIGKLLLTERDPQNDKYLMWTIDEKVL